MCFMTTSYTKGANSMPLLKCAPPSQVEYIMKEIHKGICRNHTVGQSLAFKTLRQGYYSLIMKAKYMDFAKKCDKYQRLSPISKAYPEELTTMTNPWLFAV